MNNQKDRNYFMKLGEAIIKASPTYHNPNLTYWISHN
jgi:hypothetical protein